MSASISKQALGGAPAANAALVVAALAAAQHHGQLDAVEAKRASDILADLLCAAAAGGFVDSDIMLQLAARRRYTGLIEQLAADVVARIGGPDKFFALLDLSTTPDDWKGFTE